MGILSLNIVQKPLTVWLTDITFGPKCMPILLEKLTQILQDNKDKAGIFKAQLLNVHILWHHYA